MNGWQISIPLLCLLGASCGRSARHYFDIGAKQDEAGRYDDAIINYRKAIQKNANMADAYYGLGRTLLKKQKTRESFAALERAVALAPDNMDAKRLLADLALAAYLGDSRRPKVLYDKLTGLAGQFLSKNSNSYDGLRLKGYLAETDHNLAEAAPYFRRANEVKPMQPEVVIALAQALFQDAKTAEEGERLIRELLVKRPDSGAAYDVLYRRYVATNRLEEAETILKMRVSNNPYQPEFIMQLAEYYRRSGRPEQSTATLGLMLDDPKHFAQARLQVGDYYYRTGNQEKAIANYEEGARVSGPDKLAYQKRLVGILAGLGRDGQALALAEQVLKDQPRDPELRTLHAVLLIQKRNYKGAISELQELVKAKGDDPVLRFHLGRALIFSGSLAAGRAELQQSVQLRRSYLEPRMALATLAVDTAQFQSAQTAVDEILAISPGNPQALVIQVTALQGLGRFAEARSILGGLQKRFPNAPGFDVELGFLNLHEKKLSEAERVFRKSYQAGQENLRPLLGLVQTLDAEKRAPETLPILEAELAKAPNRPQVQFMLAESYASTGNFEKAKQVLEDLAAHSDLALVHLRLGSLQIRTGEVDRGIATLKKASMLAPQSIEPLLLLGSAQSSMQRVEDAKQSYRAALKVDSGNLEALNNLAFILADTGGSLDEALKLAVQALQKAPKQANITDTMGYVYLKMRKDESALQVFRNLVKQYPSNPTYRYHHGLALLDVGNRLEAKAELQAALAAKPAPPLVAKIQEALKRAA
jgi:tetratricopeptide (TPR) repeat protein